MLKLPVTCNGPLKARPTVPVGAENPHPASHSGILGFPPSGKLNQPCLSTRFDSQPHPSAASSLPCLLYLFIPSAGDVGDVIQGPDLRLDSILEVQLLRFYLHLATSWNTTHTRARCLEPELCKRFCRDSKLWEQARLSFVSNTVWALVSPSKSSLLHLSNQAVHQIFTQKTLPPQTIQR